SNSIHLAGVVRVFRNSNAVGPGTGDQAIGDCTDVGRNTICSMFAGDGTPDRCVMKDAKETREARLKRALRENLKRRKSQARGRSDEAAASSETADVSLDDASAEEPGQ